MIWLVNETVAVEAPAPHGDVFAPELVPPELVPPELVLPEPEPVLEPLPPGLLPPEQPAADVTVARVAKERMRGIAPRMKTVLSRVP